MRHLFEYLYPEIRKIEYELYNKRTDGEELQWLDGKYQLNKKIVSIIVLKVYGKGLWKY